MDSTSPHCDIVSIRGSLLTEYYINAATKRTFEIPLILEEIVCLLGGKNANPVTIRIILDKGLYETSFQLIDKKFGAFSCPITWLCPQKQQNPPVFMVQIHAVTSPVQVIEFKGEKTGCTFEDKDTRYYMLSFLSDKNISDRQQQTYEMFEMMQSVLQSTGLDFSMTARTWLFADEILRWYKKLNLARDQFFTQYGIFNKLVPASTGISISNPFGSCLTAELLAIKTKSAATAVSKVDSPLQCSALNYRSSFSRAVQVCSGQQRRLYISGTASIAPDGKTIHLDNCPKQIELTMNVVQAILSNVNMTWGDVVRTLVYFKDHRDFALFDQYCLERQIRIPHLKMESDVCRDDLLFEIEADAIVQTENTL